MKIVIDSGIPYVRGVFEPFAEVVYEQGAKIDSGTVRDADALIVRTRTRCDSRLLEGSRVKMIATATIGTDHIDADYCRAAGIRVADAAGSNARGVLQWVAASLAYLSLSQGWSPTERHLGVVGVGHVGSLVARYAKYWGFNVLCCDPPLQRAAEPDSPAHGYLSLDEIAARCDIVTFHVPLTLCGEDATFHIADARFLDKIRTDTLLLNSSRGAITDTQPLLRATESGRCTFCMDTWENEPHIDRSLLALASVATPHIAGYSAQGKANAASMAVAAVAHEFALPITDWYPTQVNRTQPRMISWDEMMHTIDGYFDIAAQTALLKTHPEQFEQMRDTYNYRQEYF